MLNDSSATQQATALAEIALLTLRENGVACADILSRYTTPHDAADRAFEARQIAEVGRVYAPAALVKKEMRRLLTQ